MDYKKTAAILSELVSMPEFRRKREEVIFHVIENHDLRQKDESTQKQIIAASCQGLSFGSMGSIFLDLIQFDLVGLGPSELFFHMKGWTSLTTWGGSKLTILGGIHSLGEGADQAVIEIPVGFFSPTSVSPGIQKLADKMQCRFDDMFPILRGTFEGNLFECVRPPVTSEAWLRISRID